MKGKGEGMKGKKAPTSLGHGTCPQNSTHSLLEPSTTYGEELPEASPGGRNMARGRISLKPRGRGIGSPSWRPAYRDGWKVRAGKKGIRQGPASPTTPSILLDPRPPRGHRAPVPTTVNLHQLR